MEELNELTRHEAAANAALWTSHSTKTSFDTISISLVPSGATVHKERIYDNNNLFAFAQRAGASDASASGSDLRLVSIGSRSTDNGPQLNISQSPFFSLLEVMAIDSHVLYLIEKDYDGLHIVPNGPMTTVFVGTWLYALAWSFDCHDLSTRAIYIDRSRDCFPQFTEVLERFQKHISSPALLAFITAVHMTRFDDVTTNHEIRRIHDIARAIGYDYKRQPIPGKKHDINQLTTYHQLLGGTLGNIANQLRHLELVDSLFAYVMDDHMFGFCIPNEAAVAMRKDTDVFRAAVPILRSQRSAYGGYIRYLKEQAERISEVLFGLLTHEDSLININIANISTELAQASREDSSTMKAIAILTMAFLPATFFATLFALPTLQWDSEQIVQSGFKWFWIFSVPATFLMFLVWLTVANWKSVRAMLSESLARPGKPTL